GCPVRRRQPGPGLPGQVEGRRQDHRSVAGPGRQDLRPYPPRRPRRGIPPLPKAGEWTGAIASHAAAAPRHATQAASAPVHFPIHGRPPRRAPRWRLARRRTHFPLPGVAPMLDANLKTQLQAYLERLTRPVHLVASLDDGDSSKEMLELLQDIEGLSSQVSLEVRRDDAERKPSFAITSPGQDISLRFAGLPMG